MATVSIILPAKNEGQNLVHLLPVLRAAQPDAEIIVVDDGSTDDTVALCKANGVHCVSHPYSMGNGAAIKTGARNASHDVLLFMDADGQHDPTGIQALLDKLDEGYEMAVSRPKPALRTVDGEQCAPLEQRAGDDVRLGIASGCAQRKPCREQACRRSVPVS